MASAASSAKTITPNEATKITGVRRILGGMPGGKAAIWLRARLRGQSTYTNFKNLQEGVFYPFEVEYVSDTTTSVVNIRGVG